MLEIGKATVSFDERDMMDLERIITDADEKEALWFQKNKSCFLSTVGNI